MQLQTFLFYVRKTDQCWEWTAGKTPEGYGQLTFRHRTHLAHRVSWILHFGEIPRELNGIQPPRGVWVLHKCDNPSCVRPDHLFLGSCNDNIADMVAKGRNAHGNNHGLRLHPERRALGSRNPSRASPERLARGKQHGRYTRPTSKRKRLTMRDAEEVRTLHATGSFTQQQIADQKGMARETVSAILREVIWKPGRPAHATGERHWSRIHPESLVRGERNRLAKATEDIVRQIRARYIPYKVGYKTLGKEYGLSFTTVRAIVKHRAWRHVA